MSETNDITKPDWNTCPECDLLVDLPGGEVNQPGERFACRNCGTKLVADYFAKPNGSEGEWILLTAEQYDGPRMNGPMTDEDFDPEELDPGVRRLVLWLRGLGFDTTDSGDGRTKLAAGFDEGSALPYPHVAICVEPENLVRDADRLADLLQEEHGIEVGPTPPEPPDPPRIEASYDPSTGTAMLLLLHVDDSMLRGSGAA